MDEIERNLFRFMASVQLCGWADLKQAFALITKLPDSKDELSLTIENINTVIKSYDLEIVARKSDVTGDEYVSLVNMAKSSISEHAKFFDKKTTLLFSKILQNCAVSDGVISDTACVNLSSQVEMSKTAAQCAINDLITKKWLEAENGMIYLGVRSLSELSQLLTSCFPNVKLCPLCNNAACYGKICFSCGAKGHIYCFEKFWERSKTCPHCKCEWPTDGQSRCNEQLSESEIELNSATDVPRRKKSRRVINED